MSNVVRFARPHEDTITIKQLNDISESERFKKINGKQNKRESQIYTKNKFHEKFLKDNFPKS